MQDKIQRNARELYKHKVENNISTKLASRCNDFKLLEDKYKEYILLKNK